MNKQGTKNTVDINNIDIELPTVDIGRPSPAADRIMLALTVPEYRTKKFELVEKSAKLKNMIVAYKSHSFQKISLNSGVYYSCLSADSADNDQVYQVKRCVDCCAGSDETGGKVLSKALAACLATRSSCAVIADENDNLYICTLNKNFDYRDINSNDDYSSQYGSLTLLETRGKTRIPDPDDQDKFYKISFLVTADGYPLVPVRDREDFLENNEYYHLAGYLERSSNDLVTELIYVVKSGELEKYITGVFYRGESD
jgi:hypothetical protein